MEDALDALDDALRRFHHHRKIFQESGVRPTGFSLPRQHSLVHYRRHIENFGAPNGLSSSITESKPITTIKKLWRRSSHHEALKQMLIINTRNDKLAAARIDFSSCGMLDGTCLGEVLKKLQTTLNSSNNHNHNHNHNNDPDDGNEDGWDLDADEDEDPTGAADGPPALSEVTLAQKRGQNNSSSCLFRCF